jgi:hypothetical protein
LFHGNTSTTGPRFENATNLNVHGLWTNGSTVVFGGGSDLTNTNDARLDITCLNSLFIGNSKRVMVTGIVDTLNFSTGSSDCAFFGIIKTTPGGVANTGTNNSINGVNVS